MDNGGMMLTTKEAIEKRRSIRKFKSDTVSRETIMELIDAARLAPSGCNAQPWRFKIVEDKETKEKLAQAAHKQQFIAQAPVVLVCCADISGYIGGTVSGIQDLGKIGALEDRIVKILCSSADELKEVSVDEIGPRIAANVTIAIEHIILRALDFGLGTCWIRLMDENQVKDIFGWDENMYVVALLPIGIPDESPAPRKRLPLGDLIL
jgi:nitroreductase